MRAFSTASCSAKGTRFAGRSQRQVVARAHDVRDIEPSWLSSRRDVLLSLAAASASLAAAPASATAEGFALFLGADTPPTSYGGYGGTMREQAKYSFEYPEEWKSLVVNKVQKGTQGIDCILQNPKIKGQRAFVITLARAGEDRVFKLTDYESTFASFTGADSDLQDAVQSGDLYSSERMVGSQLFYDYVIEGSDVTFRASITINMGKVYALFIRCPSRNFGTFKGTAEKMLLTFRTL